MRNLLPFTLALLAGILPVSAEGPFVPLSPKQLLGSMPKPKDWKMTASSSSTTRLDSINTVATRSFECQLEIDGEMKQFKIDLTLTDTGGKSAALNELSNMPEMESPTFIVKKSGDQTLMLLLEENGQNIYRTAFHDRFLIQLETDLPRKNALPFLSPSSYPQLRSAPQTPLPDNLRAFQSITYNELDPSKNSSKRQGFETAEDVEEELNALAAQLDMETAEEEEEALEKKLALQDAAAGITEEEEESESDE